MIKWGKIMAQYLIITDFPPEGELKTCAKFNRYSDKLYFCELEILSKYEKEKILTICKKFFYGKRLIGLRRRDFLPKAFLFDMDGTVIKEESFVEMAKILGLAKEIELLTDKSMNGEISFMTSFVHRVSLLKGVEESILLRTFKHLNISPGIDLLIEKLSKNNIPCFLISGGIKAICQEYAIRLKFKDFLANDLMVSDRKFTGEIKGLVVDEKRKLSWMKEICQKNKIE